jgi:PhnB protein
LNRAASADTADQRGLSMKSNIYLFFRGQCEEALKFYAALLGGRVLMMLPHAGTPAAENVPAEWQQKILHGRIAVGDSLIMGSDAPPGRGQPMNGFSVNIMADSAAEAERIFGALAEGGEVYMPLEKTFFAERFGMVHDRFGTPWMINCEHA